MYVRVCSSCEYTTLWCLRACVVAVTYKTFVCLHLNRIIPESIPWLIAKKRTDEAKEILQRAATRNNIELPKKYRHYPKDSTSSVHKIENDGKVATGGPEATTEHATKSDSQEYSLIDIMSSPTLRLYSGALFYLWYVHARA